MTHPLRLAALLALLLACLAGCGGGSDFEDDSAAINPPDCRANPETCK